MEYVDICLFLHTLKPSCTSFTASILGTSERHRSWTLSQYSYSRLQYSVNTNLSCLLTGHLVTLLQHVFAYSFFLILMVSTSKGFWYNFLCLGLFMSLKDTFAYHILLHWDQLLIDGYWLAGILRQSPECTSPLSLPALFWHLGSSLLSSFFVLSSTCLSWA